MNIRVFTDLRFTESAVPTGVAKHVIHMTRGLAVNPANHVTLLAMRDQVGRNGQLPTRNALSALPLQVLPLPWKVAEAMWTGTCWPAADRWCGDADWVYCPKNDLIPIKQKRLAVTIHGASELDPALPHLVNIRERVNRVRRRIAYNRIVEHADVILTVSDFLRTQVIDWFDADPKRVCVVGNGVEDEFFKAADAPVGCSGEPMEFPFVLCVGGLNYLDGGDRVLAAAHLLLRKNPDLRVLVAGCQHEDAMKRAATEIANVKLLGYVSSGRLAYYMRDAVALLFPTRYETFGIAAAEAMAVGTPVVASQATAVPEVVGDAGIYVNPENPETIVEAILNIQSCPAFRQDLVIRGRCRAQVHTWSRCVARLERALLEGSKD